jgi:hypothetical protein
MPDDRWQMPDDRWQMPDDRWLTPKLTQNMIAAFFISGFSFSIFLHIVLPTLGHWRSNPPENRKYLFTTPHRKIRLAPSFTGAHLKDADILTTDEHG